MVKLSEILDVDLLQKHVNERLVGVQKHPFLPLLIYNYTQRAQFANVWGDNTIDYCRGLIVDHDGNVVARPFKKFHNLNTPNVPETLEAHLPNVRPNVTEKMDGSLGILWQYEGNWGIATRGSFTSDQAKWATEWYKNRLVEGTFSLFSTGVWTPLFEILYPENRIVCKYDFEGLVLLGMVEKKTGYERPQYAVEHIGEAHGFAGPYIVKDWGSKNVLDILPDSGDNREGYVLTFEVGEAEPPLKVKVKFDEYCRIHKIVTGVSPKAIWELVSQKKDRTFIQEMPDHFRTWAENWIEKLFDDFSLIHQVAGQIYIDRPVYYGGDSRSYRAECAKYFQNAMKELEGKINPGTLGVMFAMLDGKEGPELDDLIWKLVKPRGDDQSFRTDGE